MRFHVLGPIRLGSHTPTASKLRAVLGLLLVQADNVVSIDTMIDELWGENPPRTATTTVQVYVSNLRKACAAEDAACGVSRFGGGGRIVTAAPGYLMRTEPGELDVARFESLRAEGVSAAAQRDLVGASHLFREALRVWSGSALAGVRRGALLNATALRLEEQRMSTLDQAIAIDLILGRHRELLGELTSMAMEHPFDERVHAHFMTALYRSDRQSDALLVFNRIRRTLVKEMGTEPGSALRTLHERILRSDPGLLWRPAEEHPVEQHPVEPHPVERQRAGPRPEGRRPAGHQLAEHQPAEHQPDLPVGQRVARAEHVGLITAVQHAYRAELWHVAWDLADGLRHYLQASAAWPEWETVNEIALAAARHIGDQRRIDVALRTRELIRRRAAAG
jgi:DNA-binding SARP family transcriptional activator